MIKKTHSSSPRVIICCTVIYHHCTNAHRAQKGQSSVSQELWLLFIVSLGLDMKSGGMRDELRGWRN